MIHNCNEGYESPVVPNLHKLQTPVQLRTQNNDSNSNKRLRSYISPSHQHGIDLIITARFGHMHSLLIFADDSPTFESLLDPSR